MHKRFTRDQRGMALVFEVVIIALVVGAVGFVGWRIYAANKKTSEDGITSQTRETSEDKTADLKFDRPAVTTDPIGDPMGPFYHNLYKATGADGLNFTKDPTVLIEHASVPDIIKLPSGKLAIYAVDGANRSRSGLLIGLSDDEGKTWEFGSLQADSGSNLGADPEAVVLPDGKVRLYFIEFGGGPIQGGGPPPSGTRNKILSAISEDGLNFIKESGVRFEYESMTDPDVVKIGDKYFMYISQGRSDIAASSSDGLTFSLEKTIRTSGSVSNTVSTEDNFRQYYCSDSGIGSAVTADGLNFSDDSGDRIKSDNGEIICDPAPIQTDVGWLMVYKVGPKP